MSITDVSINKPVFAWMLMAATVVFGLVALSRIGISQFPDVDSPTISVSVTWEGAAPEVMEHDVVEPLDEASQDTHISAGQPQIEGASRKLRVEVLHHGSWIKTVVGPTIAEYQQGRSMGLHIDHLVHCSSGCEDRPELEHEAVGVQPSFYRAQQSQRHQ